MDLAPIDILPLNARYKSNYLNTKTSMSGFPWFRGENPAYVNLFGKKEKKKKNTSKKEKAGWCLNKNGRIVRVYKIKKKNGKGFKKGRYFSNGKKVPKGTKCNRLKSKVIKRKKRKEKKEKLYIVYNSSRTKRNNIPLSVSKSRAVYRSNLRKNDKGGYRRLPCNKYTQATCGGKCHWTGSSCVNNNFGHSNHFGNNGNIEEIQKYIFDYLFGDDTSLRLLKEQNITKNDFDKALTSDMKVIYADELNELEQILFPNESHFGINPTNRYNYQMAQWATNTGTPTFDQINTLSGRSAYNYPMNSKMNNAHFYKQRINTSGYGF